MKFKKILLKITGYNLTLISILITISIFSKSISSQETTPEDNLIELEFKKYIESSSKEKISLSRSSISEIKEKMRTIVKMAEDAREKKDVILLNCINEKLINIKALLLLAEDSDTKMQEELAKGNLDGANHEFRKVLIAKSKVRQLFREAEACIGEGISSYAGKTEVKVTYEITGLEEEDPTALIITEPAQDFPPDASPYK